MPWAPMSPWRLGATQTIACTNVAAQNATAFGGSTNALMLTSTTDCHVRLGSNPTAVTTDTLLKANTPYVIACGIGEKLSVVQDSANGTLYITELTH